MVVRLMKQGLVLRILKFYKFSIFKSVYLKYSDIMRDNGLKSSNIVKILKQEDDIPQLEASPSSKM